MNKLPSSISRNALFAILQVLVSGACLFLIYRFLLVELGPESLGVWSLVLATTSASRVSELGLAAGAVKFVAEALARNEPHRAGLIVQTAMISVAVSLALMLVLATPAILWWLTRIVPTENLSDAKTLLPFAMVSVWVASIGGVAHSSLDGCHRADLRATLTMISSVFYLCTVWQLAPQYGLVGLGIAQLGQALLTALASWLTLRRQLSSMPCIPFQWNRGIFREMLGYGVNFQIISIANILYEPITKTLVAKFGGLSATAYYEMANRMVLQVRAMVIAANRVLVPTMAALGTRDPGKLKHAYQRTYRVVFLMTVAVFVGLIGLTPLIERVWIQKAGTPFCWFVLMVVAANVINTLSAPAYFMNLATGHLSWNVASHVVAGVAASGLGLTLGSLFGVYGSVGGASLGLAMGSLVTIAGHRSRGFMNWTDMIPRQGVGFTIAITSWSLLAFVIQHPSVGLSQRSSAMITIGTAITTLPLIWTSPLRREVWKTFFDRLRPSASSSQ